MSFRVFFSLDDLQFPLYSSYSEVMKVQMPMSLAQGSLVNLFDFALHGLHAYRIENLSLFLCCYL